VVLDAGQLIEGYSDTITILTQPSIGVQNTPEPASMMGATSAGSLMGGRYRIVRFVGKGGFGATYEAQDTRFQSGRSVALKEMSNVHLNAVEKAEAIRSFRQEANLIAQLKHFNMPNVIDFFEENGNAYLVMEYIQGTTLENQLEIAEGPLDEGLVMGWALQLCDVLHYLHTRPQPIIFRDLKPSNVMVTKEGQIKLIDFGIARIFKIEATKDTRTLGSLSYAAIEQYGLGQSDVRTDIYALGATLYTLLTGTAPVDALLRQAHVGILRPPRELNPALSVVTEQIILKAMALEPRERFQSASEMFGAIEASSLLPAVSHATRSILTHSNIAPEHSSGPQVMQTAGGSGPPGRLTPPSLTPESGAAAGMALPDMRPPSVEGPPGPLPPDIPLAGARGISRRRLLLGGLGAAAALALGGTATAYLLSGRGFSQGTGGGAAHTITIPFTCSTEKSDWVKVAVDAFHNSGATVGGKAIQIELDLRGSLDAQQKILNGTIQPVTWSPASFIELNQLSFAWQQAHAGKDIIISSGDLQPKELVFSPLVFAVWQERARVLLKAYSSIDWPSIHDALKLTNWADIGGQATWGPVKFGHTRPDQSNSGLLTIVLLAYSFFNEQRELTVGQVDDPQFLNYFNSVEGAAYAFGRSSGSFIMNVVIPQGPPEFDIVTTYENLVLTGEKQAISVQHQPLELFYPSLNIVSDHPFAILQGSWVTSEQLKAAQAFRDFLLSAPQQRLALTSGFRPTNVSVQLTDNVPGNVFMQKSSNIQIPPQVQPLAQVPTTAVINELIKQWKAKYDGSPTTLG